MSASNGSVAPLKLKKRRFDPFQLYEVSHKKCSILRVEVYGGSNVTKGWLGDLLDIPDPYLILHVKGTPNRKKRTPVINNCPNPQWNVSFQFYIDPTEKRELFVTLMDSNYLMDEEMGTKAIDLSHFTPGFEEDIEVDYECGAKVKMKLSMVEEKKPNLRFSLALSEEEKYFVKRRRMHIFAAMQKILGSKHGPKDVREVPIIGVLGSGGGFRATMSFAGVFKALDESGLLDCVMYAAGLSGSSWWLSYLYSHPDFPHLISPGELIPELRERMAKSWKKLLTPMNMYKYVKEVTSKASQGQPVSFTDIFGHLVGDTLLKERKGSLLSQQRAKLARGQVPMPMYTCLNVKKDVSARVFQDWMEFSPYEIGCAKYGTFLRTEDFGSKFYVGKLLNRFKEPPLHFLMGVWGSAFCILFKRLMAEGKKKREIPQLLRGESERTNSISEDTKEKTFDEDEESEDSWVNTLPVVGEDSELYEHYCANKKLIKSHHNQPANDELVSARSVLVDTESGMLWDVMDDNCDSGSSDSEMDGFDDDSSGSEDDESSAAELALEENGQPETEKSKKSSVASLENGDVGQKSKPRKLSKQKAMEMVDGASGGRRRSSAGLVDIDEVKSVAAVNNSVECERDSVESEVRSGRGSKNGVQSSTKVSDADGGGSDAAKNGDLKGCGNSVKKKESIGGKRNGKANSQKEYWKEKRKVKKANQRKVQRNFWKSVLETIFQSGGLGDTRAGRAGLIFNPLRGLSLQQTFPISPFSITTPDDDMAFKGFHEAVEVQAKKLYLVDSGLTFNSPYPLLLRPQRAVDIYLSFDFSGRLSDLHEPFKEIILAEKWARLNSVPFPPVAELSKKFLEEPMRELYVFENPNEANCPIILHFIIFNGQFKEYKDLGVKRETEEEKEFADFKVFSDPEDTYSMFHFCYNHLQFNRICQLMEFNTKLGMKTILQCMQKVIERKQSCHYKSQSMKMSTELQQASVCEETDESDEEYFDSVDDL
ncbi:cytosolic phospholipase A2-like isoform X2 [Ischnura elegans]|uniref:cytosolic phospholipase A2-like isoform X2 n=1 Tax=Ischnura elegans TaxID=197161 RepID=UPI001ED885AE|nr:cytosolic phospholipase A2-like isoform X2 [Ischnura elegans]